MSLCTPQEEVLLVYGILGVLLLYTLWGVLVVYMAYGSIFIHVVPKGFENYAVSGLGSDPEAPSM